MFKFGKINKRIIILLIGILLCFQLLSNISYADSWVADIDEDMDNEFQILNHNTTHSINKVPKTVEYNGKLYIAWAEENSNGKEQVRICEYDDHSNSWTFIDGDGDNGLNFKTGESVSGELSIDVSNGVLYVSWEEWSPTDPNGWFSHVSKYNGTPGSWTRIDGGTAYGIRNNTTVHASSPKYYSGKDIKIIDYDNKLYATWIETPYGSSESKVVLASYDGSSWTIIDGQLNTDTTVEYPDMEVYNGGLYITFEETSNKNIVVKRYTSGTGVTDISSDLKYNSSSTGSHKTNLFSDGTNLYAIWDEKNSSGKNQIRVKKYDGANWTSIDGGGNHGLNYEASQDAYNKSAATFNGDLYIGWYEKNGTPVNQMRIKKYDLDTNTWTFMDDNGLSGGNGFSYGLNIFPHENSVTNMSLTEYNGELYLLWEEDGKLYAKKYDPTWSINEHAADLSGLQVSDGSLSPSFDSNTTQYTVSVGNDVTNVTVTPTVTEANATVTVNGVAIGSGSASQGISLDVGSNDVEILVTSHRGVIVKKYRVKFIRLTADGKVLITPTEDVWIDDWSGSITAYGTESNNFAGDSSSYGVVDSALEKFDYSFLQSGTITDAVFKIYIPAIDSVYEMGGITDNPQIDLYYSDDDSWNEISSGSTLPIKTTDIANGIDMTGAALNAYYLFNHPELLNVANNDTNKVLTLVLQGNSNGNGLIAFNSDDAPENKPILELTYQFQINYLGNGNEGGIVPTDSAYYSYDDPVTILDAGTMTKSGYNFKGWNTKLDGSGTDLLAGDLLNITKNTTLYAQWNPAKSATVEPDQPLTEQNLNDRSLTVTLNSETFYDSTLDKNNFTLNNGPAGLRIESVSYEDDTHATINLAYDGKDFDSDITDLGLTIANEELLSESDLNTTNSLTVSATNDAEILSIADDGEILEGKENGEVIAVTLTGGAFNSIITSSNWTVTNLPAGVSKGTITRVDDTTVNIALNGNSTADYDTNITNVTVECTIDEYMDATGEMGLVANTGVDLKAKTTPTVSTGPGSSITSQSAVVTGNVMSNENAVITERGIEYKRNGVAEAYTSVPADTVGTGEYSVDLINLIPNTTYDIRAYATNEEGTSYGTIQTFTTDPVTMTIAADLTEKNLNEKSIAIALSGTSFIDNALEKNNFTLNNGPTGLSIESITYIDHTHAKVNLAYDGTDFDRDIDSLGLTVDEGELVSGSVLTSANTLRITALWEISFNVDGGSSVPSQKVEDNGKAAEPQAPNKTGYTFGGWYGDSLLNTPFDFINNVITGDTTIYVKWASNTETIYTVEHYQQDVTGNSYTLAEKENLTGVTDSEVTAVAKNYTGFNENTSHDRRIASGTIAGDGSLVLKLYYDRNPYTVIFKDWDGTEQKTEAVRFEGEATAPTDPTRTGYTFTGWDKDYTNITRDLEVTARYSINQYTARFESNGGSLVDSVTVGYNTYLNPPINPTKEDHEFLGWFKDVELKNKWRFDEDTIPAGDISLYGKWAPSQDSITMVASPSHVRTDNNFNQIFTLEINNDTVMGTVYASVYESDLSLSGEFSGLSIGEVSNDRVTVTAAVYGNLDSTGTGVITLSQDKLLNRTSPLSVDIMVTRPVYSISYNSNGATSGSIPTDNNSYGAGDTVTVEGNTGNLVKNGYIFGGWNTQKDGSGVHYKQGDTLTMGDTNITLYAQWTTEQNSVTFIDYDGTELKVDIVENGGSATAPMAPSREGYSFNGWDKDFSNITGDMIVKAEYKINQYLVTFDSNGGGAVANKTVEYNTRVKKPIEPVRSGYHFQGWYEDEALTDAFDFDSPIIEDTVLYASWSRIKKDDHNKKTPDAEETTKNKPQDVIVIVNGQEEAAGEENIIEQAGEKIVQVKFNSQAINKKIEDVIHMQSQETRDKKVENMVELSVATQDAKQIKTILTGDIVKRMDEDEFKLSIRTRDINYIIPAKEIEIDHVAKNLGVTTDQLKEIEVEVNINKVDDEIVKKIEESAKAKDYEIVFPPVNFEVVAKTKENTGKEREIKVAKFNQYVQRIMRIPDGVEPSQITTGFLYNEDGTFSHIPTTVYMENGKGYAKLNSLTNSRYSVVWNPINVKAVENHWSKNAVNDMASRLIIKHPQSFKPDENITREDFAEYITKALGVYRTKVAKGNMFKDISATSNTVDAIEVAAEYEIINGYPDGTFRAKEEISREEAMVMYSKAMDVVGLEGIERNRIADYKDNHEISAWAYDSVKKVLSVGVFNGKTNDIIAPKDPFTYAEAAAAIRNLLIKAQLINE